MSEIKLSAHYKFIARAIEYVGNELAKTNLLSDGDLSVSQNEEMNCVELKISFIVPFSTFQSQSADFSNKKGAIIENKQIKKFLIDNDLTVAEMARQLVGKPGITSNESSLAQMLSETINGRRWYPTLSETVNREFGLNLVRPKQFEPKVRLKQVA